MNTREKKCHNLSTLLSCMIKVFMDSSNVKFVICRLDASRLVHNKPSSLDSFMNIYQ